ncbi:Protein unc-79 -like protein [Halotydeus destructor]|nr:Protein unc-79 -like protein [Halotydeus destructor]
MGTRAAAFAAKIRSLQEFYSRLQNGGLPQPATLDVANALKYFSTTLLGVLKDVPSISLEIMGSADHDHYRISLFPNLDYVGLYNVLIQMVEILPQIPTGAGLGQSLLHTISCLIPFIDHDMMDQLSYVVSQAVAILPATGHKEVLDMLCFNIFPFTLTMDDQAAAMSAMLAEEEAFRLSFANLSVPSVLMVVMMYTDVPAYYTQLIESLMKLKSDVAFDLLQVIAHGTVKARCPAVELLFQYYPELNPSAVDRKSLTEKHVPWQPLQCQHENCASSALSNEAVKLCIDHTLAIGSADKPPPMLICLDCADVIYRSKSRDTLMDILLPMEEISYTCENKTCKSAIAQKVAMVTCFSAECTNYNCNKPIRYCAKCHESKHISGEHRFLTKHMVQKTLPSPWAMDQETQGYLVEAVIALLKEAQPFPEGKSKDGSGSGVAGSSQDKNRAAGTMPTDESMETMALEERQLMSRYGVWLITSLCTPTAETPDDVLGRLLAMLFQWFHCTACLPDDQAGSALERLKGECIHGWLMKVVKTHFQVLANTLLPHPVDYAKVGGHWDCWPSQTNQIKEGFKRLLCLVPYDIITLEVWSHIMPFWMECFRHEVPEEELAELKILLSKVLDPDLSPLGFTSKQMYQFIAVRLDNSTAPVQEQALYWIQILTMLEVPVPIKILLPMLESAMTSLAVADRTTKPYATTVKIQTHISISSPDPGPPQLLSTKMRRSDSDSRAKVKETQPPTDKELAVHCYILMLDILVKQMELQEVKSHKGLATKEAQTVLILLHDILSAPWEGTHKCGELRLDLDPEAGSVQCLFCELVAIWHQLALSLIEFFSPMVEITMGDLQADPIIPPPKKNGDTGDDKPADQLEAEKEPEAGTVLSTAGGKYTFTLEKLPIEMQLFFALLHEVEKYKDADILYHILGSLKIMCLNAEVLNKAASQQRGFLVYCQENLLLRNLWALLQAEFSQISQLCVPLLLHCITLPTGRDMFWRLVEENFHDHNWKARFTAVERVTTVAHFVEPAAVKNSPSLQSSLANAFCYLVHCLDDIESTVAQRALLNLETIKISSLRLLIWCLETQFDLVMIDRPMILQTIFQLYNHLSDRRLLTWDFFLNRFDSLFLESQVTLEASGDLCQTRDLRNTNTNSEAFRKKVTRAQEALSHAHVARSLSASFTLKLPYKRAMSAPLPPSSVRQHPARQASAPTTGRRKSSRLTDQLPAGVFIPEKLQSHYPASIMSDNQLRELAAEEAHLMQVIHGYDQDDQDHDSMHLLITLMMQFLSRPDHSHPAEEKVIQRNQQLVLRHLNILLGYSPSEKVFSISPAALRELPVFNAFITSMPKVLDFNMKMGNILLTTCLPLLIYAPSPQKYFQELVHAPLYSLWHLHPHQRQTWLMVVQIIMYKYTYETAPASKQVQLLIAIVMNTLEAQFHRCKPSQHVVTPVPTRSRDMSTASIDLGDTHDHASDNENGAQASQPVSETEEEDDEPTDDKPELAAIPESPKREEVVKTEDSPSGHAAAGGQAH